MAAAEVELAAAPPPGPPLPPPADPVPAPAEKSKVRLRDEVETKFEPQSSPLRSRTGTSDEPSQCQIAGRWFLEHPATTAFTTIMTIYALFGDDIRQWGCDSDADSVFEAISTFAFFVFVCEFIASCAFKPGYLTDYSYRVPDKVPVLGGTVLFMGSFYFWLDLMATLSLVLEIPWMYPASTDPRNKELDLGSSSSTLGSLDGNLGKNARAGRTARSARGARVLRLIRLVRLIKFFRVFNNVVEKKQETRVMPTRPSMMPGMLEQEVADTVTSQSASDETGPAWNEEDELPAESEIGKRVSELTTRNVIVGVLTMLIILPLIQSSTSNDSDLYSARLMHRFFEKNASASSGQAIQDYSQALVEQANDFVDEHEVLELWFQMDIDGSQERTEYNTISDYKMLKGIGDIRRGDRLEITITSEIEITIPSDDDATTNVNATANMKTFALLDDTEYNKSQGMYGFFLTIFVIIVLVGATAIFTMDVNMIVITPIENMIVRVQEISDDPMTAVVHAKDSTLAEGMETTFLLRTIDKIGNLMRIGFGEAGAEIIARNLRDTKPGEKLNLLGGSRVIHSIFGFCDIRNFTDTTECLQEEVMTFVNSVAHILHAIVKDCNGAANKNIGDAFLLSWRLPAAPDEYRANRDSYPEKDRDLFDKALYAFTRFSIDLKIHDAFLTQFSPPAARRLYERMPGYTPRMGMGLHVGRAVEGAIGSDKKIDATYISRAVNYSEFLESSTKTYKVPLLMSGQFFKCLTETPQSKCRKVDCVSTAVYPVFEMHTYDMDLDAEYAPKQKKMLTTQDDSISNSRRSARATQIKKKLSYRDLSAGTFRALDTEGGGAGVERIPAPVMKTIRYRRDIWDTDKLLIKLRRRIMFDDGDRLYGKAMDAWSMGDWDAAKSFFEQFQAKFSEVNGAGAIDGPTAFMLDFMASHPGGSAPSGWKGIHAA